jgi:phosphatidylglycerol:prolipoprotein diacylglycerol transferase
MDRDAAGRPRTGGQVADESAAVTPHTIFDLLAALTAAATTIVMYRWRLSDAAKKVEKAGPAYAVTLLAGAAVGSYGLGTLNLFLSGEALAGRSIIGGLAGGIAAVELYKLAHGIRGSTGVVFVPGFAVSVAVGRWGCFFSGLDDHTYGTPTSLPWGHDFGDGVTRHPVQIYESLTMTAFLCVALVMLRRRDAFFLRDGFYLMVLVYAAQRFVWEFFKPYTAVLPPFNIFHLVCASLIFYSWVMLRKQRSA